MAINSRTFYQTRYAKAGSFKLAKKYSLIQRMINERGAKRVLDVGGGDGGFLLHLKDKLSVSDLFLVDISSEAVSQAKEAGLNAYTVDIDEEDLPFPEGFFDVVFCGEVIEHLFDTDHFLQEIKRVLAPQGIAIITTPNLGFWLNRILLLLGFQPLFTEVSLHHGVGHPFHFWVEAGHIRIFTLTALIELIQKNNFKIVEVKGFGINTEIVGTTYGKKWVYFAKMANQLFRCPSLCPDIMVVALPTY